ncbi:MAG: AraC family ligand binding domain-containing protein, partial [Planctomycetes bacterium]|nr:AraC family ligand binding domain-containing protein [Planctomycetota bacterium]
MARLRARSTLAHMHWSERIAPQVHTCWSGSWARGAVEPARLLVDHELVLVARGRCQVELGGVRRELGEGGWVVIPPAAEHLTRVLAGPCTRHCLHFDWEWRGEAPAGGLWWYP